MQKIWNKYKFSDLESRKLLRVEDGNHGEYRPRRNEFVDDGIVFVRAADMNQGKILFSDASRINKNAFNRIRKGIGKPGDVLLSSKGTVGKVALASLDCEPFVCSPQVTFWRSLDHDFLNYRFLYYYINSHSFLYQVRAKSGETDMADYISLTNQRQFSIDIPPLPEQKAIAHILGTLDDKIELNNKMNQTLEAIAQAIFKSWFVDFDPVRAKMEGQQPVGMDAATAELFPASFEDSELGKIPKGWEVIQLGDIADIKHGYAFKGEFFRKDPPGDILLTPGNFSIGGGFKDDKFKYYCGEVPEEFVLVENDLIVTMTDLSKASDTLGYPALVPLIKNTRFLHNQRLGKIILSQNSSVGKFYLYYLLCTIDYRQEILASATGTTVKHTSPKRIKLYKFASPSSKLALLFENLIRPIRRKIYFNNNESETLSTLRDTLLPKLMSGEIRVAEAEKQIENVL